MPTYNKIPRPAVPTYSKVEKPRYVIDFLFQDGESYLFQDGTQKQFSARIDDMYSRRLRPTTLYTKVPKPV